MFPEAVDKASDLPGASGRFPAFLHPSANSPNGDIRSFMSSAKWTFERQLQTADSTGRCNSLMESFGWRFVIQCLPWALVQPSRYSVQFRLRICR